MFPKPVGREVGEIRQGSGAQFDLPLGVFVGSAQCGIGPVFLCDVGIGRHQAAIGQDAVHDGQDGALGADMLESAGLRSVNAGDSVRHPGLQFFEGFAGGDCVMRQQLPQRLSETDCRLGHTNQLCKPPVAHHQPQVIVEQGNALVNVIDGIEKAGHRTRCAFGSGLAPRFSSTAANEKPGPRGQHRDLNNETLHINRPHNLLREHVERI